MTENIDVKNKIIALSNYYYNVGLEKAKSRDLSGAIESLNLSLKFNKNNINSRNLLGLVYYGEGEYVKGMSEWIISSNISSYLNIKNNLANYFLGEIKKDSQALNIIDDNIREYNKIIKHLKNKNFDLISLKLDNLVRQDKSWIYPRLLLGLIYIKIGNVVKAKITFQNVLKIDRGNLLAKKALFSINKSGDEFSVNNLELSKEGSILYKLGSETIIEPRNVFKNKYMSLFNKYGIPVIITFLVVWFFLVPIKIKNATKSNNETIRSYVTQLKSVEDDRKDYEALEKEKEKTAAEKKKQQEKNLKLLKKYNEEIDSGRYNSDTIIKKLDDMEKDELTEDAKALYDNIITLLADSILRENAYNGYQAYVSGDYKKCVKCYEKVMQIDEKEYDGTCMYQLAVAYSKIGEDELALEYFNKVINTFPGSDISTLAQDFINKHPTK